MRDLEYKIKLRKVTHRKQRGAGLFFSCNKSVIFSVKPVSGAYYSCSLHAGLLLCSQKRYSVFNALNIPCDIEKTYPWRTHAPEKPQENTPVVSDDTKKGSAVKIGENSPAYMVPQQKRKIEIVFRDRHLPDTTKDLGLEDPDDDETKTTTKTEICRDVNELGAMAEKPFIQQATDRNKDQSFLFVILRYEIITRNKINSK